MGKRGKGGQKNSATVVKTRPTTPANPAIVSQMMQAYGQTSYGPNAPLLPYPGLQPKSGPRAWAYPIASNLNLVTRDNLTPFEILRQFAELYDAIRICKQSWFDCAANLEPDIVPSPGLLGKGESADKYADDIQFYKDFFDEPDRQHSIHEWMNAALDDLSTIDAVAIYPRLTYSGDLYSLDLVDGSTIKPLLDDRGRTPASPFYAYEQVVYGAPSELFTVDELLYLKEHNRTHSAFGFSRVENILMRVNQALRKQSLDMALFTDGNIPAGFVSPAADLGWTPDQLQAFQTILDSLYAGNDALRSRLKMMPPGSNFTPTNPIEIETAFDLFLLTVTCASFGTTPADAGFTQDVNRSSGETQADVLYRRTLKPIALRFSRLFNFVLKKYFNERRFLFQWKGYEAAEDFGALVTAHTQLVAAGIEKMNDAAIALKLPPQGPDVPRFIITTSGPFVVDDLANKDLRSAQVDAQMAGLQMATQPQDDNGSSSSSQVDGDEAGGESEEEPESSPSDTQKGNDNEKQTTHSQSIKRSQEPAGTDAGESDTATGTVLASSGETFSTQEQGEAGGRGPGAQHHAVSTGIERANDTSDEQTGMMLAFMLDPQTAKQLALPGGEPPEDLHITLAYLGDMEDEITDDKLRPNTSPVKMRETLAMVATGAQPLTGTVGGVGRFFPAETEETPIIALVDVPGLSEFRTKLVQTVEAAGYFVADNHGYTPHITLAYIDASAPMPVESVPGLPLDLNAVWLCVGNDRYTFPIGGQAEPDEDVIRAARADLRKWRDMAISRMSKGSPLRPFVSSLIPSQLHARLDRSLDGCDTVDDIKLVFASVQDQQITSFTRSARTWRQPPPEQLTCEQQLADALKALVKSGKQNGKTISYHEVDPEAEAQKLAQYFEQAQTLGKGFAQHQLAELERGIGSGIAKGIGSLVGKAVDLVNRALDWATSLFTEQVDGLGDDASADDIEAVLESVAEQVADTLAETDIQTEVESAVMDALQQADVAQVECVNEPDACSVCVENAGQGPIPLGSAFASGQSQPPFHNRCRCHVQAV